MSKKRGDRKDGKLLKKIDSMHYIMPLMYPNRCDNEACMNIRIDLTKAEQYLANKNADNPEYKYNLFQVVLTAVLKTVKLRPKMNYFIANGNMYERNDLTAAFTVKKIFSDNGGEALARIYAKDNDNIDSIHNEIYRQVSFCRSDSKDQSTASMDIIQKIPGKHFIGAVARFLDRHGWMPSSIIATDPYYCSVVLTNLGSLKMDAGYHHMTNWGTNSVFCVIGMIKKRPFYDDDGNVTMRQSVNLSLTIDERIADGYYYAKTIRLLKHLIENPELLELPLETEVEY
ncbi:MAG: 2-oxo acid dehydrogenase subunit E2 [Acutalibacteraceae bacterium]|nr:2-oxo acid dehydrogenase subunit E2 [Acutalibacteraceae bacterium]